MVILKRNIVAKQHEREHVNAYIYAVSLYLGAIFLTQHIDSDQLLLTSLHGWVCLGPSASEQEDSQLT